MPPWQSSDNFQVSEHHPILRAGLTLHNPIAGLRKAVRPQELGWFLEDQQMGAWGTDCRPVLIWTVANASLMRASRCLQKRGLWSDRYTQANKKFQLLSSLRGCLILCRRRLILGRQPL